jgi:hypothetical protein
MASKKRLPSGTSRELRASVSSAVSAKRDKNRERIDFLSSTSCLGETLDRTLSVVNDIPLLPEVFGVVQQVLASDGGGCQMSLGLIAACPHCGYMRLQFI